MFSLDLKTFLKLLFHFLAFSILITAIILLMILSLSVSETAFFPVTNFYKTIMTVLNTTEAIGYSAIFTFFSISIIVTLFSMMMFLKKELLPVSMRAQLEQKVLLSILITGFLSISYSVYINFSNLENTFEIIFTTYNYISTLSLNTFYLLTILIGIPSIIFSLAITIVVSLEPLKYRIYKLSGLLIMLFITPFLINPTFSFFALLSINSKQNVKNIESTEVNLKPKPYLLVDKEGNVTKGELYPYYYDLSQNKIPFTPKLYNYYYELALKKKVCSPFTEKGINYLLSYYAYTLNPEPIDLIIERIYQTCPENMFYLQRFWTQSLLARASIKPFTLKLLANINKHNNMHIPYQYTCLLASAYYKQNKVLEAHKFCSNKEVSPCNYCNALLKKKITLKEFSGTIITKNNKEEIPVLLLKKEFLTYPNFPLLASDIAYTNSNGEFTLKNRDQEELVLVIFTNSNNLKLSMPTNLKNNSSQEKIDLGKIVVET